MEYKQIHVFGVWILIPILAATLKPTR